MAKTMGYEGLIYYGVKGAQAATQILNCVDVSYENGVETGSTTSRGDGSSVPIETGEATLLNAKLTFNMIVDDGDAVLVALLAAARTGNAVALRYIRSSGLLGLDADCVISAKEGAPLKGEQTVDFTVEKLSASDRTPLLNS
jgi:hypothetical protein|tara:strand:- start:320 stop:745 length:426 start_codon:yes stop_codon:yes gene_type:complete